MTDPIHEQISAFVDGELPSTESELLLKRLQRDPGLRATVGRYSLMGEALRGAHASGAPSAMLSKDFADRVANAIERDLPRGWPPVTHWLKPVAGGAIAAGVAAVALVSFRVPVTEPMANASAPMAQNVEVSLPGADVLPSDTVPLVDGNMPAPPIRVVTSGRLANFVIAHSEYSSPLGRRNVLTGLIAEEEREPNSVLDAEPDSERRPAVNSTDRGAAAP